MREDWKKIHSSIFDCDDLNTSFLRDLFISLILASDLWGRMKGSVAFIRRRCFYLQEEISDKDLENGLKHLAECKMIVRYKHNDKEFIEIVNHNLYNPPQKRHAGVSKFPEPTANNILEITDYDDKKQVIPKRLNKESVKPLITEEVISYIRGLYPSDRRETKLSNRKALEKLIKEPEDIERVARYVRAEVQLKRSINSEIKSYKLLTVLLNKIDTAELRERYDKDINVNDNSMRTDEEVKIFAASMEKIEKAERIEQIKMGRLVENMTSDEIKLFNEHSKISYDEAYAKANSPEFQKQVDMLANKFRV